MDAKKMAAEGSDTIRNTARFIGISERQIYRLIARGELYILREGTRVLVPRCSAQKYVQRGIEKIRSTAAPARVA